MIQSNKSSKGPVTTPTQSNNLPNQNQINNQGQGSSLGYQNPYMNNGPPPNTGGRCVTPTPSQNNMTSSSSNNTTNQIAFLQNRILDLTSMMAKEKAVHNRELDFIRNLLYTLYHSRGFLSITDQFGTIVNLSEVRGDYLYDCRVREDFQIRTRIKKVWGNEHYFKALLGNQERTIQLLNRQVDFYQNKESNPQDTKVPEDDSNQNLKNTTEPNSGESLQSAQYNIISSLGAGIEEIITLMETTCQRYPQVYFALREQHSVNRSKLEKKLNKSKSQRMTESESQDSSDSFGDILEKILDRCKSRIDMGCERDGNPSLIPCPSPKGGGNTVSPANEHKITPNGTRATTPPPSGSGTRSIVDFEKFIGAAMLHVRGREQEGKQNINISPEKSETISVSPRNGKNGKNSSKEGTTMPRSGRGAGSGSPTPSKLINNDASASSHTKRKKSRKIVTNKSPKKSEQDRDAGDNSFLISSSPIPVPVVPGTNMANRHNSPRSSRSGSPAAQSSGTQSLLTLTTGSSSCLDNVPQKNHSTLALVNKSQSQSQFSRSSSSNSSFPVLPVKRQQSVDDNIVTRSQSLPPISPILLASSSLKFKTPTSRSQQIVGRSLSRDKFGGGKSENRPLTPSPLSWSRFGVGSRDAQVDGGILTQRKQKVGGGGRPSFAYDQDTPVTPPPRKMSNSKRPKTSEPMEPTSNGGNTLPTSVSTPEFTRAGVGMSCPYCCQDFDKNMSPDDVRKHLEKHCSNGDLM